MSNTSTDLWHIYFKNIKDKRISGTEFTPRTDFENLLNDIKPSEKTKIIHETKREKGFGAPDFRVERDGAIIGYIETKNLGENLDKVVKTEQFNRYLALSHNIIVTNYHEFILYRGKIPVERCNLFYLTDLEQYRSKLKPDYIENTVKILNKLFIAEPQKISDSETLAVHLAERAKILKEFIFEFVKSEEQDSFTRVLKSLHEAFKNTLVEDLKEDEFADAFAQTLIYGLFLARLNSDKNITARDASLLIPQSFEVIKELFRIIQYDYMPAHLKWIIEESANLINNIDLTNLYKSMSFKDREGITDKDPYIYFYETFLAKFDKKKKQAKGVYYTPLFVVSFITRSIDKILLDTFGKQRGFADPSVTVLDFAAGTGTFLVAIFELILDKIYQSKGEFKSLVKEHLLKNFYGFDI